MSETAVRGRGNRVEQMQARRRRRDSLGADRNLKLHVPEDFKEKGYEYRWVNDRPGRVQQLHSEDWDVVEAGGEVDSGNALGTQVKRVADRFHGENAILMRKPTEFYEADKLEKKKALDKVEDALRRGAPASPEGLSGPHAYVPGGKNTIGGK